MSHPALIALSEEIEAWAQESAFRSSDDIPRLRRRPTWLPELSPRSVAARRGTLADFRGELAALEIPAEDVTAQVVRLQSGYLYHYAFVMLIGIAALLTWAIAAGGLQG